MKLLSLEVKNYRVHRETTVDLDAALVFIGGPNETGKSTLIEAVHRGFFLRAGAGGATRESMRSRHGGDPEVMVRFEHAGKIYQLKKTFRANGNTVLVEEGGPTWQGASAEEQVQAITGAEALGGQGAERRLPATWAHLWTWQGKAGEDPIEAANPRHGDIIARLQEDGGAVVMQSARDARLADGIRQEVSAIFKENNKPKAGSLLGQAVEKRIEAEGRAARAAGNFERLQQAADEHARAVVDERNTREDQVAIQAQLAVVEAKLGEIARWEAKASRRRLWQQRRKDELEALAATVRQVDGLAARRAEKSTGLAPARHELEQLEARSRQWARDANTAEELVLARIDESSRSRRERDHASAWLNRFEKHLAFETLAKTKQTVDQKSAERANLADALAILPKATAKLVKEFQEMENRREQAWIAVQSMATGLEVLAGPETVRIGGEILAVGVTRELAEVTEVTIGDGVRLRLRPGGGNALAEARVKLADAEVSLQELRARHGFAGSADAAETQARRAMLEENIRLLDSHLQGLGAEGLSARLAAATKDLHEAEVVLRQREAAAAGLPSPADLADARMFVNRLEQQTAAAESRETEARAASAIARQNARTAHEAWSTRQQSLLAAENEIQSMQTRVDILMEPFGNRENLDRKLERATRRYQKAEHVFTRTAGRLADLQPELAALDKQRLLQQTAALQKAAGDAEMRKAVAANTLAQNGVLDPRAEYSRAQQALLRARAEEAREQSRADALKLLDVLFREERQTLSATFIQPLADKINAYLQCLFGAEARINIRMKDDHSGFDSFSAVRRIDGPGELPFDLLSGGAREQVAAAIRLAVAEVLASGHGGTLPVFFDDAFAFSDPERVAAIQRMLYLASQRGLQIIVLACNPRDYAALGAGKSHPLQPRKEEA